MRNTLAVSIVVLFLTACSAFNPNIKDSVPEDDLSLEQRQEKLRQISDWGLRGRLSFRSGGDGTNASVIWDQQGDNIEVKLFGAFGAGAVRIMQKNNEAALYRSGEKPVFGLNAEELLLWETGLRIPLKSLSSWLRGLPGNGTDTAYDSYGRLRSLHYVDEFDTPWAATFERYRDVDGYQLPVRMRVESPTVVIQLVAEQWDAESQRETDSQRLHIPGASS